MIGAERIQAWRGQQVLDPAGEQLGKLEEVFLDSDSEEPILIAVKSGLLGRHTSLIPLDGASVGPDYLRVSHTKETVDQIPDRQDERAPDAGTLEQLGVLYGIRFADRLHLETASEIERRKAEAEAANARAQELETAAHEKAAEHEQARARVEGTQEEAERARAEAEAAQRAAERAREEAARLREQA
jgi:hypothetical protein